MQNHTLKFLFLSFLLILNSFVYGQFKNVSEQIGIQFVYGGSAPGAGVSFIDVDQDGWDDLTLADTNGIHLYLNQNGQFLATPINVAFEGEAKQVLWGDIDNDGDLDLFITGFDAGNRIYEQKDHLVFEDITEQAGLPMAPKRHFGACFGDIDRDGDLDLYYVQRTLAGENEINVNRLFLNEGQNQFKEISIRSESDDRNRLPFCAAFVDINNDLWPDIYIANDRDRRNTLLMNDGNFHFTDVSEASGADLRMSSMSVTPGDFNQDGFSDIYISDISNGNALLKNLGLSDEDDPLSVQFEEVAESTGTGFYGIGWGAQFMDGDNDGDLDLYVSGINVGTDQVSSQYLVNDGLGNYTASANGFIGDTVKSFSNACGDFNNDGLMDIAVQNHAPYPFQLWSNSNGGNWIKITLKGIESNFFGVGSKISLYSETKVQHKYTTCGSAFLGQNSQHHIFGINTSEGVDSVIVKWPSGHIDKFVDMSFNTTIELIEGSSTNNIIHVDSSILMSYQRLFIPSQKARLVNHVSRHKSFMGGGAAFFDYDNDGDDDLYITAGSAVDQLYENTDDGTFHLVNDTSLFEQTGEFYTMGVVTGDLDNDGDREIFVTTWNDKDGNLSKNLLYENLGNGAFREIWQFDNEVDNTFSLGATMLDYDNDGLLDIYVANYVSEVRFIYDSTNQIIGYDHDCFENHLYKNLGGLGFQNVSEAMGVNEDGCTLAIASTDYNQDGQVDLMIANDFGAFIEPNKLFENNFNTDGHFKDVSESTQSNIGIYGMGVAIGDIDFDLDMDYYITNFGRNLLMENQNGVFTDATDEKNVTDTYTHADSIDLQVGWGTAFFDADNDQDLDLFVSNGYVPSASFLEKSLFEQDKIFIQNEQGTFDERPMTFGINNRNTSRGMAISDFDQDGDVDILSVVLNIPVGVPGWETHLFENTTNGQMNWIEVKLEGVKVNRDAFGSKVIAHTPERAILREVDGGSSHCSQHSSVLHFGLGNLESIDSIEVIWTGGQNRQVLISPEINQKHDIKEIVDGSTALQHSAIEHLEIIPNPSSGKFIINHISLDATKVDRLEIFTAQGRKVESSLVQRSNQLFVSLNDPIAGVYLVQLQSNSRIYTGKLIIQ